MDKWCVLRDPMGDVFCQVDTGDYTLSEDWDPDPDDDQYKIIAQDLSQEDAEAMVDKLTEEERVEKHNDANSNIPFPFAELEEGECDCKECDCNK